MKKDTLWQVVTTRPRCMLRLCLAHGPSQKHKVGFHLNAARLLGQQANKDTPEKESLLIGAADGCYVDCQPSDSAQRRNHPAPSPPPPPPKGYLAVYVGSQRTRFVIPATFLSMPEFKVLMDEVAEEFGFEQPEGGLQFPCCEEADFREILSRCRKNKKQKSNH